jgi:hypothetical protein
VQGAQPARSLWRLVLAATITFVVVDFVSYPTSPDLRAAAPSRDLTLLLTAGDASTPLAAGARSLAGALSRPPYTARAQSSASGTAHTILSFARQDEADGRHLLLLTSSALAELARGVHQPTTADEAASAAAALAALAGLRPIAPVFVDRPVLLVRRSDGPASFAALVQRLREDPRSRVAGIPADAASKAALAGLVESLGIVGEFPYRVFHSGAEAALSLSGGGLDLVLAPSSQTLAERRRRTVRVLPPGGAEASGAIASLTPIWGMIVGPAALSERARTGLARRIAHALQQPSWRRHAERRGLQALRVPPDELDEFVSRGRVRAGRLAVLVARVPERPPGANRSG